MNLDIIPTFRSSNRWSRIYALCESSGVPRYVGKTSNWLTVRLRAHKKAALNGSKLPVHQWLKDQIDRGIINLILLENVSNHVADEKEKWWIHKFRTMGYELLNLTDGGKGLLGHNFTYHHRVKIGISRSRGQNFACENCQIIFWRKPSQIKKGHNRFCSRKCSNQRTGEERRVRS